MPTPSSAKQTAGSGVKNQDWAARPLRKPQSVFDNYAQARRGPSLPEETDYDRLGRDARRQNGGHYGAEVLQEGIDSTMARTFLYRFLAHCYEDPTKENWARITNPGSLHNVQCTLSVLARSGSALEAAGTVFEARVRQEAFDQFLESYLASFGHAARGRCPLNEIEYGDLKADPLFQPHRLADLAAFYRAFGLEVSEDADERHDHLCLELEFMCVLAAKEAYALEHQLDAEVLSVCRDAQKRFLREHLGRWTPAFARRLARSTNGSVLAALADLTRAFIETECTRLAVAPGSDDLLLRPVDLTAESLCSSCKAPEFAPGLQPEPPGAD